MGGRVRFLFLGRGVGRGGDDEGDGGDDEDEGAGGGSESGCELDGRNLEGFAAVGGIDRGSAGTGKKGVGLAVQTEEGRERFQFS